jgi:starch synthase
MNILFVSSEVVPFSKTGGLADVAGALPGVLAARGHTVMVVTPRYAFIRDDRIKPLGKEIRLKFPFGTEVGALQGARMSARHQVVFLNHPGYFDRPGLYQENGRDYPDNAQRFAFLGIGALSAAQTLQFVPDIVHLNDWQTGLTALALKRGYQQTSLGRARSVLTIHNLAYAGTFSKQLMPVLGIPWDAFTPEGLEFYDNLSFLKAGLAYADALTTVSPRYAKEIQTPEAGVGLDGILRARSSALHGILNGIDTNEWDPRSDAHLPARFGPDQLEGKQACKRALLEAFGLPPQALIRPVFGVVTRLAEQKGIDILLDALEQKLWKDLTFVAVGNGEPRFEDALRWLKQRYPDKVGLRIGFDNPLAHLVEAGSDFFLMPSRYEPCGLNQMYSLRYGTVPVVRATGGLDDTVFDEGSPAPNGFKFFEYSGGALADAMERALAAYEDPALMARLRRHGMNADFSWDRAGRAYERVYEGLLGKSTDRAAGQ